MKEKDVTSIELSVENVERIFKDCLFKEDETKDGRPVCDFNIAEGITRKVAFNNERLNQHKKEIAQMIDMLPKIDEGESFLNLCMDKNDNQWTGSHPTMELLVQLGVASEILSYPLGIEFWRSIPDVMPYVIRNKEKINTPVVGKKPEEFPVQESKKEDEVTKAAKEAERAEFLKEVKELSLSNFREHYDKVQPILQMLGFKAEEKDSSILLYDLNDSLIGTMKVNWVAGGTELEIETKKGTLSFTTYVIPAKDEGQILSNVIRLSDLKRINNDENNKQFSGRYINIELGKGITIDSSVPRFEIKIIDPNAENKITDFNLSSFSLYANLENDFGPYGNYVNGTHRSLRYDDPELTPYMYPTYFMNFESVYNGDSHYINLESKDNGTGMKEIILNTLNFRNKAVGVHEFSVPVYFFNINTISKELLSNSRTKNLVEYVLDSINKTVPGIRDYIMNNYSLINKIKHIMDTEKETSQISKEIQELFDTCHIEECDLPCEKPTTLESHEKVKEQVNK